MWRPRLAANPSRAGEHLGALTRSKDPEHDLRREAISRIESLGVSKDALRASVQRGEHTPLSARGARAAPKTSCRLRDAVALLWTTRPPRGGDDATIPRRRRDRALPNASSEFRAPTGRVRAQVLLLTDGLHGPPDGS